MRALQLLGALSLTAGVLILASPAPDHRPAEDLHPTKDHLDHDKEHVDERLPTLGKRGGPDGKDIPCHPLDPYCVPKAKRDDLEEAIDPFYPYSVSNPATNDPCKAFGMDCGLDYQYPGLDKRQNFECPEALAACNKGIACACEFYNHCDADGAYTGREHHLCKAARKDSLNDDLSLEKPHSTHGVVIDEKTDKPCETALRACRNGVSCACEYYNGCDAQGSYHGSTDDTLCKEAFNPIGSAADNPDGPYHKRDVSECTKALTACRSGISCACEYYNLCDSDGVFKGHDTKLCKEASDKPSNPDGDGNHSKRDNIQPGPKSDSTPESKPSTASNCTKALNACTHGVVCACEFYKFCDDDGSHNGPQSHPLCEAALEKRDDEDDAGWWVGHACGRAQVGCTVFNLDCACEYLKDCNENGEYQGDIPDGSDHCLCHAGLDDQCEPGVFMRDLTGEQHKTTAMTHPQKRSNPTFPTELSQAATIATSSGPYTMTAVVSVLQTIPSKVRINWGSGDLQVTQIRSAISASPNVAADYLVLDGVTFLTTKTHTTNPFNWDILSTPMISEPDFVRRAEPTANAAQRFETLLGLGKRLDHLAFDSASARPTDYATTEVTVVNDFGTYATLTPTTNAEGRTVLVEAGPRVSHNWKIISNNGHAAQSYSTPRFSQDAYMPTTVTKIVTSTHTMRILNNEAQPTKQPAVFIPTTWHPTYAIGFAYILSMPFRTCRDAFKGYDWNEISRIAWHIRENDNTIDPEDALRFALILLLRSLHPEKQPRSWPSITSPLDCHTTSTIDGIPYILTKGPQTINGHVIEKHAWDKFYEYDPLTHAIAPTGNCLKGGDKKDCKIEQCMWRHMEPMKVTTVEWMSKVEAYGGVEDYFTHKTMLHWPHWGTTSKHGLYYPATIAYDHANGTDTSIMRVVRATPTEWIQNTKSHKNVHPAPTCTNAYSCWVDCDREVRHSPHHRWGWKKILLIVGGCVSAISLLLFLCCWCLRRRRNRRDDDPQRKPSTISEKLRRKSQPDVVVNQVTGNATNPATGQPVNPSTASTATNAAVVGGPAAGAAAANEKATTEPSSNGGEGRGTTGRRAEEGRGKVNFADGGAPGAESPTSEVREVPAEKKADAPANSPETHTEEVPAQHDGTADVSGRQMVDVGSMRGRKRNRPGLNLGF